MLRVSWAVLPLVAGPSLGDALDGASIPVRTLSASGLWAAWVLGVLATFVVRSHALTALRILAPASALVVVIVAIGGHPSVAATVAAFASALLSASGEAASAYANGAAYPNERRFPLRSPAPVTVFIVPIAWTLTVVGATAGPLLLAARQWVAGAIATAVGVLVALRLVRSLHALSRRWAVLVPAGLVLHDPLSLVDAVLFKRGTIEVLRPAPADSDALDLTQRAPGLALELVLREKVPMVLERGGRRPPESGSSARLLFTPIRPGALLTAAAQHRISTPA